jgi:hydroxymethylpyrimidine pyrophosphatase-like HAD family hydrolase
MYTVKTSANIILYTGSKLVDAISYAENQKETVQIVTSTGSVLYEWSQDFGLRDFLVE